MQFLVRTMGEGNDLEQIRFLKARGTLAEARVTAQRMNVQ